MTRVFALALVLMAVGCHSTVPCRVGESRCHNDVAEVCGSDEEWHVVLDCQELREQEQLPWHCVPFDGGHLCSLPETDAGGAQ